jgi:hypothetical protein
VKSVFFGLVVAGAIGCHTTPSPPPNPTPVVSPATIWAELLDAGCVAPDDGGPASIASEEAIDGGPTDAWLTCMAAGGSAQACNACNGTSKSSKFRK